MSCWCWEKWLGLNLLVKLLLLVLALDSILLRLVLVMALVSRIVILVIVEATCVVWIALVVVWPLISSRVVSGLLVSLFGRVGLLIGVSTLVLSGSALIVAMIVILLELSRL